MARNTKPPSSAQVTRLRKALDREKAKSAALANERSEAREQQDAAAEILKVISRSPADVQPVFDAIVRRALRLIDGRSAIALRIADGRLHLVALTSTSKSGDKTMRDLYPMPVAKNPVHGKAIRSCKPYCVSDTERVSAAHGLMRKMGRARGYRSLLVVPMLRDGVPIGSIGVSRKKPGVFSRHQIRTLETFADQAVIAIENARMFNETREALERQTATAEILKVIAGSPSDVQPVFDAIVRSATVLINGFSTTLTLVADGKLTLQAFTSTPGRGEQALHQFFPIPVQGSQMGEVVQTRRPSVIVDTESADSDEQRILARARGFRSVVFVPLMRGEAAIGTLNVTRREPGVFTDHQIELLQVFADQAVIAIENVRMFNETKEALEHQQASSDILRIVSQSVTDSQPAFQAILAAVRRLFGDFDATVWRLEQDKLVAVARGGATISSITGHSVSIAPDHAYGIAIREHRPVWVDDVASSREINEVSRRDLLSRNRGAVLFVPFVRDGDCVGAISVSRTEPYRFSERQVALLKTFADQAVIAIENMRMFNETKEALEQQTAISEVLRVISSSPADVQPVLEAVAVRAARICDASDARIALVEGDHIRHAAGFGDLPPTREHVPLERGAPIGRAVIDRATVYITDIQAETGDDFALAREIAAKSGWRSNLVVPLMRKDTAVGAIALRRRDVRPFSPKQISLLKTFADQAAIAIENVRLFNETKEALEQQTATAEILKVISGSPTEVQPVFDAIAQSAVRLCGAMFGAVFRYDGELVHFAAHHGFSREALALIQGQFPRLPRGFMRAAIVDREVVNSPDVLADPRLANPELARALGHRSVLAVPMLREGQPIGGVIVFRKEVGPFADAHINLLTTFADQAVIAIENVRLFNETKEALERQTAIGQILRVMSDSPSDVTPVLDAVVESSMQICESNDARIFVVDGNELRYAAGKGAVPSGELGLRRPLSRGSIMGRTVIDKVPVQVEDLASASESEYPEGRKIQREFGHRTTMGVPLLREGKALGVILLRRMEVRPFSDKQISLLQTFADQAAIAIENVRLFNETKEALERQTATAEVLQVLSGSPSSLQPVFEAILGNATRLCNSHLAILNLYQDGKFRTAAQFGGNPQFVKWVFERAAFHPSESMTLQRMIETRQPVQAEDLKQSEAYRAGKGQTVNMVNIGGARTFLAVPLFKEGDLLGNIGIYRPEVLPFTDKQVDLVRSFANQAVIAIENVRLFNETREALERQIATADILKVIGSSPTDTQPVFEAIVQGGLKLFPNATIGVTRPNGERVEMVAIGHRDPAIAEATRKRFPIPLTRDYLNSRAIIDARMIDLPDAELEKDGPFAPGIRNFLATGNRAMTVMPMLRGDEAIGTISVTRDTPGPLTDKQLSLLRIFADQAVIAIENVRLFNETKEMLERQTATAEILKVIASSPSSVQPVFDAILENATRLCEAELGGLYLAQDEVWSMVSFRGEDPSVQELFRDIRPGPLTGLGRMRKEGKPIHIADLRADAATEQRDPVRMATLDRLGARTFVAVPLTKDGAILGAVVIYRREVRPFTDAQIRLVRTFADQAVIAIENVRLFNETKEALERQTATAEILKVIASSPNDVQPVFNAIAASVQRLFGGHASSVTRVVGDMLHLAAFTATSEAGNEALKSSFPRPLSFPGTHTMAALSRKPAYSIDFENDPNVSPELKAVVRARGIRSQLSVPMLRDGVAIGTIAVTRTEPGQFSNHQISLMETFADQAVIAIENVRLFQELEARTNALTRSVSQLTALGEVGQAISSTLDLEKVLKTIAAHAVQLTGLDVATIYEFDEATGQFELRAWQNLPEDLIAVYRQMPIRLGEGVVGKAAELREPVQIPDIHDPGYQTRYRDLLIRQGYRAILAVPMLREGRIVGAITVSRSKPGEFASEVVELLKTFATQSALAIQNARLFREIADKSRQLEEASKHKSHFLASMSHELRTPLNAILGFNEMLLGEVYGPITEDMQPPLAQMQTSGKHLLRLINNVLDLAKIEAGRMELALSDYSVHDTVESVRATLRPLAAEKGLEFLATVPADIPLAYGDPGRITQCLMNLAGNSLKFTKVGKVEISVTENGHKLTYRVADTGIGIPPDKIDTLFTEFKQTDATIASEYGGTGLGLSISKKFVEMHGGRIWVESEPGQGSTFIFEIPLRAGEGKGA